MLDLGHTHPTIDYFHGRDVFQGEVSLLEDRL